MTGSFPLSAGQRRVRVVALALAIAAYLLSFFHRVAPAAISQELAADFQASAASLGLLAAAYFWIYTAMQLPTGVLADTLGPRRILAGGGLIAGAGSILFGLAPSFVVAAAGRTLVGLGVAVAFIAMLKIIAVWFEERHFATLTGLALLLGNVGSVLAGAPLAWMTQLASWRHVFVGLGVLSLLLALMSAFFVRDRPKQEGVASEIGVERRAWLQDLRIVLRNPATRPGFFVSFGVVGSMFGFAGLWAVPYFVQVHGMTRGLASNHISVYFIGFALGAPLVGVISDRMRERRPLLSWGTVGYVAVWLVWLSNVRISLTASCAACFAMGLLNASFTLSWACGKEVNPPSLSGMATSVVNVGGFLGAAIMQPLAGWVMDLYWTGETSGTVRLYSEANYHMGLLLLFGCAMFGSAATFFVRETYCRNVWGRSVESPSMSPR